MGYFDFWRGGSPQRASAKPVSDAAGNEAPNPATAVPDDAQNKDAQDAEATAPLQTEALSQAPEVVDGLPPPVPTGNAEVDAMLAKTHADLVAAFHRARQKDADKAKAKRETDVDGSPPKEESAKPFEFPRASYQNHFRTKGGFDEKTSKDLSETVPDIALHAVEMAAAPLLARIDALERQIRDFGAPLAQYAEQAWNGVRATFGSAADEYRGAAEKLAKTKGIGLTAALVEVSNGELIASKRVADQTQKQRERPSSLRSAIPASSRVETNGRPKGFMTPDEMNRFFRDQIARDRESMENSTN